MASSTVNGAAGNGGAGGRLVSTPEPSHQRPAGPGIIRFVVRQAVRAADATAARQK